MAWGLCAIQSLGNFDSTKGGHLYLAQLNLAIEFPAGCTALIPSAAITHANVPVQENEVRMSIIQYTAGGLYRWLDYGCHGEAWLEEHDPEKLAKVKGAGDQRWKDGLSKYSLLSELHNDRAVLRD